MTSADTFRVSSPLPGVGEGQGEGARRMITNSVGCLTVTPSLTLPRPRGRGQDEVRTDGELALNPHQGNNPCTIYENGVYDLEFNAVLPFLQENHMAVITTVTASGKAQSTVVSAGPHEGKMVVVSRAETLKIKHIRRTGRCTVTCINPQTMRYATVEGAATVQGFDNTAPDKLLALLRAAYIAVGRDPERMGDFDKTMRDENRAVILISPDSVYGSLQNAAQRAAAAQASS